MRPVLKRTLRYIPIFLILAQTSTTQGQFTGFGSKSAGSKQQSNDQKAGKLLHEKLPLVLDANTAYPTVPDQDMLGGPFHPRTLPVTLGSLTKPLPPGDYVLPMTFFCSEYSVHRGGNGIAYQLGPAQGTAAKAISTLLWRGMLTGHKPQELQSVSWAIQGSVAYDKMPAKYRALVDQLIPEMKNQVNGQAFADIEDGFQGKVNRVTKKISEGISKGTGGFVHADIKVDVELNESFERLGQVGRSALDGEKLNTIFTTAFPSDQAREQALYAGQGQQTAALPAANGPWSVKVPGVAYMRFVVHGGNLQGDNMMQIRILPPRASQALVDERPHLVLAGYEQTQQSTPSSPSVISLFNGSVNETALSQCQAIPVNQQMCMAQAITVSGDTGYSIGTGAQAPIMAPSQPIAPPTQSPQQQVCVKKLLYEPTAIPNSSEIGLCIYLGVFKNDNNSCGESQTVEVPNDAQLNWVQTYVTNVDGCTTNTPHKDPCNSKTPDVKLYGPLYYPDRDPDEAEHIDFYEGKSSGSVLGFDGWKRHFASSGDLQVLFRDIPHRSVPKNPHPPVWLWHTAPDSGNLTTYADPSSPAYQSPKGTNDNNLRLVYYSNGNDPNHFDYTPLIQIRYGLRVDVVKQTIMVDPLYIGPAGSVDAKPVDNGGTISLSSLRKLTTRPSACTVLNHEELEGPPPFRGITPFPYDTSPK